MIFDPSIALSAKLSVPSLLRPRLEVAPRLDKKSEFIDPLANVAVSLRLQSVFATNAPANLYTDTGLSTPAAIDQQAAGWAWPTLPSITESTLTNQPTVRLENGVPVVDFATNKRLSGSTGTTLFPTSGFAISLLVYLSPSASSNYMLAGANTAAGTGGFFVGMLSSGKRFSSSFNRLSGAGGATAPDGHSLGWQVITATSNGTQCQCFVGGVGGTAPVIGAYVPSANPLIVGVSSQGGWNNPNTKYAALIVYNPADRLAVEAYLETLRQRLIA